MLTPTTYALVFSACFSTFAGLFRRIASYHFIVRDIAKLAFPITIGQLGLILMGFTDIVLLGRLDTLSMSAAGFGNAVFFLFMLIGVGTMYAVSTLVSISDGEEKPQQAIPIFFSSLYVALFMSAVLMLVNYVMFNYLHVFRQSPELTEKGREYLWIINLSTPALLYFNSGKQLMDGLGKTHLSMYVTFVGLVMNFVLNIIMIWGYWGCPAMGLAGSAWATVIARYAMAVIMLLWAWYDPLIKHLKQQVIEFRSYFMLILKIGIPVGFTFFFEIAAFSTALIMAGTISDIHSASHQIAINLASITYMFVMGISAAANILVGNFYGAKDREGIRRSGFAAIFLTIGVELVFALIFLLFKDQLPLIYTHDQAVLAIAPTLVLLAAFFQLSDGLQAVAAGALRGIKDTKVTSIIAFVSYWLLMMPGAYFLCFELGWGISGIWIGFIGGLTFAAILLLYRFNQQTKRNVIQFKDEI